MGRRPSHIYSKLNRPVLFASFHQIDVHMQGLCPTKRFEILRHNIFDIHNLPGHAIAIATHPSEGTRNRHA